MRVTQTQRSEKFTISNITESEMVSLYHQVNEPLKSKIAQSLIESRDDEECIDEYGYDSETFWKNVGVEM